MAEKESYTPSQQLLVDAERSGAESGILITDLGIRLGLRVLLLQKG